MPRKKEQIALIIDSSRGAANVIKNALYDIGLSGIVATTTIKRAEKIIEENLVPLIITDLEIEGESSLAFIKKLRKNTKNPNFKVPILVLSGKATKKTVSRARDAGATEFMTKPFKMKDLTEVIHSFLKRPRDFIISRGYSGPDRRRKKDNIPYGFDRRSDK